MIWQTARFELDCAPRVMGIVNVTPDSFSDGAGADPARALATCERLLADGADILDIGGESTRPGAAPVCVDVELARMLPVLRGALRSAARSRSTPRKPEVMRAALEDGADIVNDVGRCARRARSRRSRRTACGVCLMHMQGTPPTMQAGAGYDDVVAEVATSCAAHADACRARASPAIASSSIPGSASARRSRRISRCCAPARAARAGLSGAGRLVAQGDAGAARGVAGTPPAQRSPASARRWPRPARGRGAGRAARRERRARARRRGDRRRPGALRRRPPASADNSAQRTARCGHSFRA